MAEALRLAVVGAGWAGDRQSRAIADLPDTRLAVVVDPDLTRAADLRSRYGDATTRVMTTADELLDASDGVDGAVLCSPTGQHAAQAIALLERGIPCLVEKPFTTTVAEAEAVRAVALSTRTPVMSGQILRSMPLFTWAAEVIGSGRLGVPVQVVERRLEDRSAGHSWWHDVPTFLVAHWGSHTIDLVSHLFDSDVDEVHCRTAIVRHGVVDNFTVQLGFEAGFTMTSTMSMSSRHEVHDIVMIGSEATLAFDCYRRAWLDGDLAVDLGSDEMYAAGFANQLAAFVTAVRTGAVTVGSVDSVLRSMDILRRAEDAASQSRPGLHGR